VTPDQEREQRRSAFLRRGIGRGEHPEEKGGFFGAVDTWVPGEKPARKQTCQRLEGKREKGGVKEKNCVCFGGGGGVG